MTTFGLTGSGFTKKTLSDIRVEIEEAERGSLGGSLNLLATSVLGQLNSIFGDKVRELWDVAEAVYRAFYPDSASAEALEGVCAITGVTRIPAEPSRVTLDRLYLDDGVTVPAGSLVGIGSTGARFSTLSDVSNALGYAATFSVEAESVDDGPIVGLSGTIDTIQTPISGWSAASALSSGNSEPFALVDGQHLLVRVDDVPLAAKFETADFVDISNATAAEVAAKISSEIPSLTASDEGGVVRIRNTSEDSGNSIQVTGGQANPALGFSTDLIKGFNSLDANLGRNLETDAELRERREIELEVQGAATLEAIRADVSNVDGVEFCHVNENDTDTTIDSWFLPHSIEVIVYEGDDQEVGEMIFNSKAAGIATCGYPGLTTTVTVTDSQEIDHEVNFTRPDEVEIYVDATVYLDPESENVPIDVEDQIKAAIVAEAANVGVADVLYILHFVSAALHVPGVKDVTLFKMDTVFPPTGTSNISLGVRAISLFDTSRIRVYYA